MVTVVEVNCSARAALSPAEAGLPGNPEPRAHSCGLRASSIFVFVTAPFVNAGELRLWLLGLLVFYSMPFPFLISDQSVE